MAQRAHLYVLVKVPPREAHGATEGLALFQNFSCLFPGRRDIDLLVETELR